MNNVAFIDMEGVLIPEIWPYLGDTLNIKELSLTTRDEPDYLLLMKNRIECLKKNQINFRRVEELVNQLNPLPNANAFLQSLKNKSYEIYIVSDCFYQLLDGFFSKLAIAKSSAHCHNLIDDDEGFISLISYSRTRGKHEVVERHNNGFNMSIAVGDAFNDFSMLQAVDKGFLFSPSDTVKQQTPNNIQIVYDYDEIILSV